MAQTLFTLAESMGAIQTEAQKSEFDAQLDAYLSLNTIEAELFGSLRNPQVAASLSTAFLLLQYYYRNIHKFNRQFTAINSFQPLLASVALCPNAAQAAIGALRVLPRCGDFAAYHENIACLYAEYCGLFANNLTQLQAQNLSEEAVFGAKAQLLATICEMRSGDVMTERQFNVFLDQNLQFISQQIQDFFILNQINQMHFLKAMNHAAKPQMVSIHAAVAQDLLSLAVRVVQQSQDQSVKEEALRMLNSLLICRQRCLETRLLTKMQVAFLNLLNDEVLILTIVQLANVVFANVAKAGDHFICALLCKILQCFISFKIVDLNQWTVVVNQIIQIISQDVTDNSQSLTVPSGNFKIDEESNETNFPYQAYTLLQRVYQMMEPDQILSELQNMSMSSRCDLMRLVALLESMKSKHSDNQELLVIYKQIKQNSVNCCLASNSCDAWWALSILREDCYCNQLFLESAQYLVQFGVSNVPEHRACIDFLSLLSERQVLFATSIQHIEPESIRSISNVILSKIINNQFLPFENEYFSVLQNLLHYFEVADQQLASFISASLIQSFYTRNKILDVEDLIDFVRFFASVQDVDFEKVSEVVTLAISQFMSVLSDQQTESMLYNINRLIQHRLAYSFSLDLVAYLFQKCTESIQLFANIASTLLDLSSFAETPDQLKQLLDFLIGNLQTTDQNVLVMLRILYSETVSKLAKLKLFDENCQVAVKQIIESQISVKIDTETLAFGPQAATYVMTYQYIASCAYCKQQLISEQAFDLFCQLSFHFQNESSSQLFVELVKDLPQRQLCTNDFGAVYERFADNAPDFTNTWLGDLLLRSSNSMFGF